MRVALIFDEPREMAEALDVARGLVDHATTFHDLPVTQLLIEVPDLSAVVPAVSPFGPIARWGMVTNN